MEVLAAILSFTGVVLVARPEFIFGSSKLYDDCGQPMEEAALLAEPSLGKAVLIIIGLIGAFASALTNIIVRKLTSVHALTTVLYLMMIALPVSPIGALVFQRLVFPRRMSTWMVYLVFAYLPGAVVEDPRLKWNGWLAHL